MNRGGGQLFFDRYSNRDVVVGVCDWVKPIKGPVFGGRIELLLESLALWYLTSFDESIEYALCKDKTYVNTNQSLKCFIVA